MTHGEALRAELIASGVLVPGDPDGILTPKWLEERIAARPTLRLHGWEGRPSEATGQAKREEWFEENRGRVFWGGGGATHSGGSLGTR